MKKIGFQIRALGCKVNQYDAAVLNRLLKSRGFLAGPNSDLDSSSDDDSGYSPDLAIVNTCSVTKKAISKDKQLIKELKRLYPGAYLVIMGCWPQTDDDAHQFKSERCLLWGVGRLEELADKLAEEFNLKMIKERRTKPSKISETDLLLSGLLAPTERSRYFLKVGDGCDQFCSYCIIPFARGRLRSRPVAELVAEATAATAAGYREIVLSGIHLGLYGKDIRNKRSANSSGSSANLSGLIKKLLTVNNLGRLRLSSIEINEVTDELINLMISEKRICRHLHISLQSGSDNILSLMKRPYKTDYFASLIAAIRKQMPDIAISTDIIVGFPGESEADFRRTCRFARRLKFSKIHVFAFSLHEKTAAAKLPGRIPATEIKDRSRRLREISLQLEEAYCRRIQRVYRSKPLSLVREKSTRVGQIRAKTEFGFDMMLDAQAARRHEFL